MDYGISRPYTLVHEDRTLILILYSCSYSDIILTFKFGEKENQYQLQKEEHISHECGSLSHFR